MSNEEDLIELWLYGAEHHGSAQADRYQDSLEGAFALLAQFPELARDRRELMPLRVHPFGSHLILSLVRLNGSIFVVRVRHERED